jgi:hypothetical protein
MTPDLCEHPPHAYDSENRATWLLNALGRQRAERNQRQLLFNHYLVLRQSLVLGLGVNHEWRFELIFASSNAGLETWNPQSLPLTKH